MQAMWQAMWLQGACADPPISSVFMNTNCFNWQTVCALPHVAHDIGSVLVHDKVGLMKYTDRPLSSPDWF